jgi:hypothetical protein
MVRLPTIAEEDAKRPNRKGDCLMGKRTRIVSRIKATLARLGIRNSNQPCARRRTRGYAPGLPLDQSRHTAKAPPEVNAAMTSSSARTRGCDYPFPLSSGRPNTRTPRAPLVDATKTIHRQSGGICNGLNSASDGMLLRLTRLRSSHSATLDLPIS